MSLTILQVKNAKPKKKPYKLADQEGLYLLVNPNGSKLWKLKYRFAGKEKKLSLGGFPTVSLADARNKKIDAKRLLAKEVDPGLLKQSKKRARSDAAANSFEAIAREWHTRFYSKWTNSHADRILIRLEKNIFPYVGTRVIKEINAGDCDIA